MKIKVIKPSEETGKNNVEVMSLEEAREYAEENVPDRACKKCFDGVLEEVTKGGGPYLSCTSCGFGTAGKVHGKGSPFSVVEE